MVAVTLNSFSFQSVESVIGLFCVLITFAVLQAFVRPFVHQRENVLDIACMLVLTFTYQVGVTGISVTTSSGMETALTFVFVVNVLMIILLVAFYFIKLPENDHVGQARDNTESSAMSFTLKGRTGWTSTPTPGSRSYRSYGSGLHDSEAGHGSQLLPDEDGVRNDRLAVQQLKEQLKQRDDQVREQANQLKQQDQVITEVTEQREELKDTLRQRDDTVRRLQAESSRDIDGTGRV